MIAEIQNECWTLWRRCHSNSFQKNNWLYFYRINFLMVYKCLSSFHASNNWGSCLTIPEFNLVCGISVDYIHCVLLGVCRQLMKLWLKNKYHKEQWYIGDRVVQLDNCLLAITLLRKYKGHLEVLQQPWSSEKVNMNSSFAVYLFVWKVTVNYLMPMCTVYLYPYSSRATFMAFLLLTRHVLSASFAADWVSIPASTRCCGEWGDCP